MPFGGVAVARLELGIGQEDPDVDVAGVWELKSRANKPRWASEPESKLARPGTQAGNEPPCGERMFQAELGALARLDLDPKGRPVAPP